MSEAWDGTERRSTDQRLSAAITEVRDLRDAAAKLATAVEVRTIEFRRLFWQVAGMLAALLIVLTGFSLWQVDRLNARVDRGHSRLTCLLLVDPTVRTAQTLIECQR